MNIPKSLSIYKLLLAIIAIHILVNLIFFNGLWILYGDQKITIRTANQILAGTTNWEAFNYHHQFRLIPVLGVVLSFALLGRSELALILPNLLSSIGCLVIIFYITKTLYNEKVALLAALLFSFLPFQITFSTICSSDSIVPFFTGGSVLFFLLGENRENNSWYWYLLSGLFLGLTYFAKETGLLLYFFYGAYILYHRKFRKEYILLIIIPLFLFLGETLFYYWKTDIWFFRSKRQTATFIKSYIKQKERYFGLKNYFRQLFPFLYFLYLRIFAGSARPFSMRIFGLTSWSEISHGYYPSFILLAYFYTLKTFRKNHVAILWLTMVLLYLEFGYGSFNPLIRIGKIPRFLSILNIPASVLLANFLYVFGFTRKGRGEFFNKFRKGISIASIVFLLITSLICSYRFSLWTEGKWPNNWANYTEQVKQDILRYGLPASPDPNNSGFITRSRPMDRSGGSSK